MYLDIGKKLSGLVIKRVCVRFVICCHGYLIHIWMGLLEKLGENRDIGASLWDESRNYEWKAEWIMFADVTVSAGNSEEKLQTVMTEVEDTCKRKKWTVNISKYTTRID